MISVQIDDSPFRDQVRLLSYRMRDLTPVLEGVGAALESNVRNRFESRTDPDGMPWAPWAQSTRDSYPEGGNRRLLDRYGDMLRSLTHTADARSAKIGFGSATAAYHEFGTKRMPRRGLLFDDPESADLADGDRQAILDLVSDYLQT